MVGMVISISGDCGGAPILGVVPGALDVFDTRADVHGRAMLRRRGAPGKAVKSGSPFNARFILSDVPSLRNLRMPSRKSGSRSARIHQFEKRQPRIEIAGHHVGRDFVAILQRDPADASFLHQNFRDGRVGADLCAPAARAESAMAFETAPMPPRTNPHNPRWPFTPPMQ